MSLVETTTGLPSELTYCPDHDACFMAFMNLLPRGTAWDNTELSYNRSSNIRKFMSGVALFWLDFEDAMCATLDEWFCLTSSDDLDAWKKDYGIPDNCDLYNPNVCAKVTANGTPSAEYLLALLYANGYVAEGRWLTGDDIEFPGVYATFYVVIDIALSPAFNNLPILEFILGEGISFGEADISRVKCMLERYTPAHTAIDVQELVPPEPGGEGESEPTGAWLWLLRGPS